MERLRFGKYPSDVAETVAFYERGVSRKNFSHAGGMKDSFDRQPPTCPSACQRGSGSRGSTVVANSATEPLVLKHPRSHLMR